VTAVNSRLERGDNPNRPWAEPTFDDVALPFVDRHDQQLHDVVFHVDVRKRRLKAKLPNHLSQLLRLNLVETPHAPVVHDDAEGRTPILSELLFVALEVSRESDVEQFRSSGEAAVTVTHPTPTSRLSSFSTGDSGPCRAGQGVATRRLGLHPAP
jgi:hypothetical protein